MGTQILFNEEANRPLQLGANKAAKAIGSTMGAAGKPVIIGRPGTLGADVTKDGVTVASSIVLEDADENIGAQMIRKACEKTYRDAGDGTTQTAVLAQSILNQGLKQVTAGANAVEVKRGLEKGVELIVEELKKVSVDVGSDIEKIRHIATTSANNDKQIGDLFADAYKQIGRDGLLVVERSNSLDSSIEIIDGYEMPRGYISPDFANDEKKRAVHEDALVLVTEYKIRTMKEILPLLQELETKNLLKHPLIIISEDYEGEFFSSMLRNHQSGQVRNCLIKAPAMYLKEHLEDIATITGATVIRDANGLKLESARVSHLGSVKKIIISEQTTTAIDGGGKPDKIESLKAVVKAQIEEMKDEALKVVWEKRLAKISGTIGVLKVGGATDLEQGERYARVDDAFRAVRSAIEEGVVVGGGVALLRCVVSVDRVLADKETLKLKPDEVIGLEIIRAACKAPLEKMLENGGLELGIIKSVESSNDFNYGYNVKERIFEDLFEAGIIDPVKVIRCALQNSASVAAAMIASDCFINYILPKQN